MERYIAILVGQGYKAGTAISHLCLFHGFHEWLTRRQCDLAELDERVLDEFLKGSPEGVKPNLSHSSVDSYVLGFLEVPAFALCDLSALRLRLPCVSLFGGTRESCGDHLVEMGGDGLFSIRFARDR